MTRGLMKTASSIAVAAAAGLFATSAMAADLGGNCCADLEERVAELEATTARKGNRKVSLTVYGQVNQAILWHDSGEGDAYRSDKATVRTNNQDVSKFGFRGEAQIRPDLTAGYLIEIGIYEDGGLGSDKGSLLIRQNHVYLSSQTFGTVKLGQASQVTDGAFTINLANARVTGGEMNEEDGMLGARFNTTFKTPYDGGRRQGVYYSTPSLAGFILSAGWSNGTQDKDKEYVNWTWSDGSLLTTADAFDDSDDHYEVALRYAGEFNGVRIAAGIGYRKEEDNTNGLASVTWVGGHKHYAGLGDSEIFMGSASVMHMPTGLFVSGGYGDKDSDNNAADMKGWWVMAGIEKNWTGLGNTTIYGEYMENDLKNNNYRVNEYNDEGHVVGHSHKTQHDGSYWGIGIVQTIDSAATDLYLNMRRYELDSFSYTDYHHEDPEPVKGGDATVVVGGMIIKF